jgi:hypothetical protein
LKNVIALKRAEEAKQSEKKKQSVQWKKKQKELTFYFAKKTKSDSGAIGNIKCM